MQKTHKSIRNNTVHCWWYKHSPGNFGDILSAYTLAKLGFKVQYVNRKTTQKFLGIGSVMSAVKPGDLVWGAGIMRSNQVVEQDATFIAVRGPLSGEKTGCSVFGDPGLLCGKLFPYTGERTKDIMVIPHYVDFNEDTNGFSKIQILNDNPIKVAHKIASCGRIISSSLHGIIVAHSYGIPAAWWKPSGKLAGDDVKFKDYAMSVGIELNPSADINNVEFTLPSKAIVAKRQDGLIEAIQPYLSGETDVEKI